MTSGSHLWTNSSNYLEKLQRGVKIDFSYWLQSHCATLKKIEVDIYVHGSRPNFLKFAPGSHLWTNSSNYLENLQKGVKIDFSFWLQSHCATLKRIEIDIYVYGMRSKFWKIDPGKPFVDKLVKLSRKLTERRKNWLQFLIAVTLSYISKNIN